MVERRLMGKTRVRNACSSPGNERRQGEGKRASADSDALGKGQVNRALWDLWDLGMASHLLEGTRWEVGSL